MKTMFRIASAAVLSAVVSIHADAAGTETEGSKDGETHITSAISQPGGDEIKTRLNQTETFAQAASRLVHDSLGEASEGEDRDALLQHSLLAFYSGSDAVPVWVNENGVTKKARDAAQEIGRAAQWGLDPKDYELPEPVGASASRTEKAEYELAMTRAVLAYADHAKAGRIHPGKVRHSLNNPEGLLNPRAFLESLRGDRDVAELLRGLHPQNEQFIALKKMLAELRGNPDDSPKVQLPDGPVLRAGVSHEHVSLLRKRLGVESPDGAKAESFDDEVEEAVKAFQKQKGLKVDGVVGNNTRHNLNGESNEKLIVRVLANMERWRWLPDDLDADADIYVWANIPEYRVRIVEKGKIAFNERVIVGKTNKQTPVFSDKMEWIEIHPTWYVPMSIIVDDIGPSLRRPTSSVMERYHLQLNCGSHGRDWRKIDWNRVSIRNCSVSQPPGDRSVLGDFKFKFPNRHDVYMHDTPQKNLFNSTVRTYSHGCMRIRNPRKMAEILLAHDKGMTSSRIGEILKGPKRLHKEDLNRHVPVHMTYFTVFFDEDGKMQTFRDVYGHDRRLAEALTGKGHLLPVAHIAPTRKRAPTRTRTAREAPLNRAFIAN